MKNCTGIFCPMQYGKVDPATCKAVDYCPQATPPKTNADRIRSMSDEELAELLVSTDGDFPPNCEDVPVSKLEAYWLDWLKQEAK